MSIQNESAIVELSNESIKFRIISLKSYYQNDDHADNNDELSLSSSVLSLIESSIESSNESSVKSIVESQSNFTIDSIILTASVKRERDRSRKYSTSTAYLNFMLNAINSSAVAQFTASSNKKLSICLKKRYSYQSIKETYRQMFEFSARASWMKLSIREPKKRLRNSDWWFKHLMIKIRL